MLSFNDFISSFSTNTCVRNSNTARTIYTHIIWDNNIRIVMAELSEANKSAILGCGKIIEDYCNNDPNCDLDLKDDLIKRTIGRMIAASLKPLGYTSKRHTKLPVKNPCTEFTSGTVFKKTETGTEKIVKVIVPV